MPSLTLPTFIMRSLGRLRHSKAINYDEFLILPFKQPFSPLAVHLVLGKGIYAIKKSSLSSLSLDRRVYCRYRAPHYDIIFSNILSY